MDRGPLGYKPMQKLRIHTFTHFFVVYLRDIRFTRLVYAFTHRFTDYKQEYDQTTRQYKDIPRVWAGRLADNSLFRFPIGALKQFEDFAKSQGVFSSEIEYIAEKAYFPARAEFKLNSEYTPRDYQMEAITYTEHQRIQGAPSVLISKPPGSGKTVTFCKYLEVRGQRAAMVVAPTYMEKWQADVKHYLDLEDQDFFTISGGKSIRKAVELARADEFDFKFVLISLRTFANFMKQYETSPAATIDEYGTDPISIWETLQIGVLGADEAHEQFHAMCCMHTFIHGVFHMALSATMMNSDPHVEKMQKIVYPSHLRFDKIKMKRYIAMINVEYRFAAFDKDRIKTSFPRMATYNQNAYEASVYKNKKVLKNWLDMVGWAVDTFFLHRTYQKGDKLGIYFARIEMLNVVVAYLQQRYPKLDIRRFAEADPYVNIIDPDVRVTTQGSGGTGKDIKSLTTVLNFNVMKSKGANTQLLGRIREIEGRDDLFFVQFSCTNIRKHIQYKAERDHEFRDKTKSISNRYYGVNL